MFRWGATVAVLLVLGSIPAFIGLAFVLPWLGYSTWHLYTRLVDRSALKASLTTERERTLSMNRSPCPPAWLRFAGRTAPVHLLPHRCAEMIRSATSPGRGCEVRGTSHLIHVPLFRTMLLRPRSAMPSGNKGGEDDAGGPGLAAAILLLLAAMALKGALLRLPSPPDAPAADGFDANRAAARLERILGDQRPHPVDSDADDAVRERLIAEMRAVGLEPRVTDDFACNGFAAAARVACARVRNLVATIGPAAGQHLLLVSHYDSTFAGPGRGRRRDRRRHHARDGGAAARPARCAGRSPSCSTRARRWACSAPAPSSSAIRWRRGSTSLLNFEARGVTGPAIMFETSRPNGAAIAALPRAARAAGRPIR